MTFVVPSIVDVLMSKTALYISTHANDWPAESVIIISNEKMSDRNSGRVSSLHSKKSKFT